MVLEINILRPFSTKESSTDYSSLNSQYGQSGVEVSLALSGHLAYICSLSAIWSFLDSSFSSSSLFVLNCTNSVFTYKFNGLHLFLFGSLDRTSAYSIFFLDGMLW